MIPMLIHEVPVVVRRAAAGVTTEDAVAREPVRQLWRRGEGPGTGEEETLSAQVNWNAGKRGKPEPGSAGTREESDGYLVFRVIDLLDRGVATEAADGSIDFGFARGDRIVRIGRRKVNLYVTFFRDVAGYEDQSGCTLLKVNFVDRAPSSPAREA